MIYNKEKHSNNDPYPNKEDFKKYYLYYQGMVVINGSSKKFFDAYLNKHKELKYTNEIVFDKEAYNKAIKEWRTKENLLHQKYKEELFKDYGIKQDIGEIIYAEAWDRSHSSGIGEVEGSFDDLIDFVDKIKKVFIEIS